MQPIVIHPIKKRHRCPRRHCYCARFLGRDDGESTYSRRVVWALVQYREIVEWSRQLRWRERWSIAPKSIGDRVIPYMLQPTV